MSSTHEQPDSPQDFNPFQAPSEVGVAADTSDERIRREHMGHESSIKTVGALFLLAAFFYGVLFITAISVLVRGGQIATVRVVVIAIFSIWLFPTSIGLIRLLPWSRWTGVIYAIINLLSVLTILANQGPGPGLIMLFINIYILSLLLSARGRTVFTDEYREVIKRTPHIKRKTSRLVIALVILLLLVIAIAVLSSLLV